jgi:hypothetical protein
MTLMQLAFIALIGTVLLVTFGSDDNDNEE